MKLFIYILAFLFSFFNSSVEINDDIVLAFKQNKASEVSKYFDEKVNTKIIQQEDVLSKSQAEANLKYFFEKHSVKNFTNIKTNTVNTTLYYLTGSLETSNGKYKVTLMLRRNLIAQLRIELENE